jgi:hypothetical protein
MKNLHKILSSEPTKKGDIAVGITLKIWDGEGDAPQHSYNLFITSDEENKEEDWCLHPTTLNVYKHHRKYNNLTKDWKKIILTTDEKLIADGVQRIPSYFIEWFVDNPKCEEVEVEKGGILYDYKYKIIMTKAETIEEAAEKYVEGFDLSFYDTIEEIPIKEFGKQDFIAGAKWQAEQFKNTKR